MRAQRRNETRVFLIKDDFPPAGASNALSFSSIRFVEHPWRACATRDELRRYSAAHKSTHVLFTRTYLCICLLFTDLFLDKRISSFFSALAACKRNPL